ncbi:MAG: hypothetical protein Ct9H300mP29_2770 [Candidatus Neomarinimicrobiota bacterium]|nr:MAG: hypothetical protein Ct9H300mP29_2770 [Candidatus Neomarinimicrobiota bacterium]
MVSVKLDKLCTPLWCDEDGKQIDDGTIQRLAKDKFRITSAEPNLEWIEHNAAGMDLTIRDDSKKYRCFSFQGPNSRAILNSIASDSLDSLKFFWMMDTQFHDISVTISRTGYTGDLGYEIWMGPKDALSVWDLLMDKGKSYGLTPTVSRHWIWPASKQDLFYLMWIIYLHVTLL